MDDALSRGATVLAGGAPLPGAGSFFAPTVITHLPEEARLCLHRLDAPSAPALASGLEASMVSINHLGLALAETPFGGIKDSGICSEGGSEGGSETFDGYLNTKFVIQLH